MISHILAKYITQCYIVCTFVQSFALHFKRSKGLCLIHPFIAIYAVASSKRRSEIVLLSKGWKQFDVFTEIKSLEISIENKYVCRNFVVKLKKRWSLIEQIEKLEADLKSLGTNEDSLNFFRCSMLQHRKKSATDLTKVFLV